MSTAPIKIEVVRPVGALRGALRPLTETEKRVLQGVFEGKSNREIAAATGMAEVSVRSALHHAYVKLGITGARGLFPLVIASGMELRTGKAIEGVQ